MTQASAGVALAITFPREGSRVARSPALFARSARRFPQPMTCAGLSFGSQNFPSPGCRSEEGGFFFSCPQGQFVLVALADVLLTSKTSKKYDRGGFFLRHEETISLVPLRVQLCDLAAI
ncbi:hypothetical protein MRX96_013859 [Rhipicephalus microplus]